MIAALQLAGSVLLAVFCFAGLVGIASLVVEGHRAGVDRVRRAEWRHRRGPAGRAVESEEDWS